LGEVVPFTGITVEIWLRSKSCAIDGSVVKSGWEWRAGFVNCKSVTSADRKVRTGGSYSAVNGSRRTQ
jgi:hypothetical protein